MPGHNFRLGSFAFGFAQPAETLRGTVSIDSTHCNSNAQHSTASNNSHSQHDQHHQLPTLTQLHSRIAVFGASAVGKTAVLHQFLYSHFPEQHVATLDQLYHTECELIKGSRHTLTLDILDTSGTYEFPAMRRLAIENADAFILVYSIDNTASFERVRRLRDEILQIKRNQMAAKARSPVPTNGRMRSQTVTAGMPIKDSPVMSAHRKYSVGALYSPKASIRRRSCVDSLSEQLAQQLVRNLQLQKKLFPEQSAPDKTDDRPQSAKSNATIDATLPAEQKLAALRNAWRTDVAKLFGHEKSRSPVAKSYDPIEAKAKCSNGDFISVFSENSNPSEFKSYVKAADVPMTTEEEVMITSDELKHIPIVVVGNKMDLEADRALSKELIETLVTMDWEAGFIECSAKSNLNVSAVFKQLMQRSDLPPIAALAFEERTCRRKSLPAYQSPIARNRLKPKRNSCALS